MTEISRRGLIHVTRRWGLVGSAIWRQLQAAAAAQPSVASELGVQLSTQEMREVQLSLLDEFDRVCRSAGLGYYLAYGTLLGAVRHRGYIPWDDDIDVMMPRKDYERLRTAVESCAYNVQLMGLDRDRSWPYPFMKLADRDTILIEDMPVTVPLGVNIDIFPLDIFPCDRVRKSLTLCELEFWRKIWAVKVLVLASRRSRCSAAAARAVQGALSIVPASSLARRFSEAAQRWNGGRPGACGVGVGSFSWSGQLAAFGDPQYVMFENRELPAPSNTHEILRTLYGDYMKPPLQEQRQTHHSFACYWVSSRPKSPELRGACKDRGICGGSSR